ncbi:MAG TPA: DUF4056 domain-containing protein [Prolixibacteraceae bacterium]|nr:DUF4056 domain-containing protein [Prolixibacteraceae bacterium]
MRLPKPIFIFLIAILPLKLIAKAPVLAENQSLPKPHRIIRTCCSFGTDMQMFALPGIKLTETTSIEKIGSHRYLGDPTEGNGIMYSRRGGFIDMGHLRDQADWTAFLYTQLNQNKANGILAIELGHEGGEKSLNVHISPTLNNQDLISLAGKIAYDLSVWHEIATWFGASTIPFVPERYSSFSIEDAYSNLLGVTIGMQALQSELPYEQAVTTLIAKYLKELEVVSTEAETFMAMEAVRDVWWTRARKLPSAKVLIERQIQVYPCLNPWIVPGLKAENQTPMELSVPQLASGGKSLSDFYKLQFRLNYKFPFRKIFPERKDRCITQNDFGRMLSQVETEVAKKNSNQKSKKDKLQAGTFN